MDDDQRIADLERQLAQKRGGFASGFSGCFGFLAAGALIVVAIVVLGQCSGGSEQVADTPPSGMTDDQRADYALVCARGLMEADRRGVNSHNAMVPPPWVLAVASAGPPVQIRCFINSDIGPGVMLASQICADADRQDCSRLDELTLGDRTVYRRAD